MRVLLYVSICKFPRNLRFSLFCACALCTMKKIGCWGECVRYFIRCSEFTSSQVTVYTNKNKLSPTAHILFKLFTIFSHFFFYNFHHMDSFNWIFLHQKLDRFLLLISLRHKIVLWKLTFNPRLMWTSNANLANPFKSWINIARLSGVHMRH